MFPWGTISLSYVTSFLVSLIEKESCNINNHGCRSENLAAHVLIIV